jgi:hypothetical protein
MLRTWLLVVFTEMNSSEPISMKVSMLGRYRSTARSRSLSASISTGIGDTAAGTGSSAP